MEERERRRALRVIQNIGKEAEQDAQSTDSDDKQIIQDIKTTNTEIYNLKLQIGANFLQQKVGNKEQKGDIKDRMIQASMAVKKEKMK